MGLRVWDDGGSECRSVMGRIGIESIDNIIPRESGQTSVWSLVARKIDKPTLGDNADDGNGNIS
jgi:hypothetical protein